MASTQQSGLNVNYILNAIPKIEQGSTVLAKWNKHRRELYTKIDDAISKKKACTIESGEIVDPSKYSDIEGGRVYRQVLLLQHTQPPDEELNTVSVFLQSCKDWRTSTNPSFSEENRVLDQTIMKEFPDFTEETMEAMATGIREYLKTKAEKKGSGKAVGGPSESGKASSAQGSGGGDSKTETGSV